MSLTSPFKDFVKRKLNEKGFHDIRALGETPAIDEFKERASAIMSRARKQTLDDVAQLRKKYENLLLAKCLWSDCWNFSRRLLTPQMSGCFAEAS